MGCCAYNIPKTSSSKTTNYKVEKLCVVYKNNNLYRFYSTGESCILSDVKCRRTFHHTGEFMINIIDKLNLKYIPSPKLSEWVIHDPIIKGGYIHKIISVEDNYNPIYIRIEKINIE
jgi:hypothetical protein